MTHAAGRDASRPQELVVVCGTATEVGKTWVAAQLVRAVRAGDITVAVRKPAQSFDARDASTDADVLGAATGEPADQVCPRDRWYDRPMAPPMAAAVLGRPSFSIADLVAGLTWPVPRRRLGLVESAGGVRSPLAEDGDTVALIEELQPGLVVLVADAGLGTINAVRLSIEALRGGRHTASVVVFLNRFDDTDELHRHNRRWLADRDGLVVLTSIAELSQHVVARTVRSSGG
jgi:dethiobiotin synthetase